MDIYLNNSSCFYLYHHHTLLTLATDKISDKMQMCCLNTQFNVFGIFRVAVQEAEEQLGPFGYHDTAPSFADFLQDLFNFFFNYKIFIIF